MRADVHRAGRLLAALGLVLVTTVVPIRQVAACDCAFLDVAEAISEADAAIVGTLVGAGGSTPARPNGMESDPVAYTWAVDRSRDPLDGTQLVISAVPDDGGNCGMTFAADGRWLVLAYETDAGLETNGCMRNLPLADVGPDDLEAIENLVARPAGAASPVGAELALPGPVIVGGIAILLVALVSALAFRRSERG